MRPLDRHTGKYRERDQIGDAPGNGIGRGGDDARAEHEPEQGGGRRRHG